MTAPSPGIISTTMLNAYYDSQQSYLTALAREMRNEYLAIHRAGLLLQIDAPDLAMDRSMFYRDLSDAGLRESRRNARRGASTKASTASRAIASACTVAGATGTVRTRTTWRSN